MEVEQQDDHHTDTKFPNPRREHRPKTMETHVDTGLIDKRVTRKK